MSRSDVSPETIVVVDSFENLHQLNKLGMELSLKIKVLIDVDAGIGRTGLNFNDAFDLAITASKNEHIELKGIQCYAGHYQHIIDKEKLLSNIKLMQNFATDNNKDVRPHAKTHKCPKICELQLQEGSVGISITKPSEALELVNCGIKNILITSPIVTSNKLRVFAKILSVFRGTHNRF